MKKWSAKYKRAVTSFRDFLDEKGLGTANSAPLSRLQRFAHFWLMVVKSFVRNRCPVHASALTYTTLLALIPMLFVVISVSTAFLKQPAERARLNHFIDRLVVGLTPPSAPAAVAEREIEKPKDANTESATNTTVSTNAAISETNSAIVPSNPQTPGEAGQQTVGGRQELSRNINEFIARIQSGTFRVTGIVILFVMVISMLSRVEGTFNDIWGVTRGRPWFARITQYCAIIMLGPALLAVATGMTTSPVLEATRRTIESVSFLNKILSQIVPVILVCAVFSVLYMAVPNTKVRWQAAVVGGAVGGVMWQANNYMSIWYVSRWITNMKIYGSLAVIPVFMVGLYLAWWILLFGAQVAYAYQNRAAYVLAKQTENISQRGREFIALRLMEFVGQRFQCGEKPANVAEIAERLSVPTGLIQQILNTLMAAQLIFEVTGTELAYAPGRPLGNITCHDILLALRAGHGQELATRDEPARTEVYGEFVKILEAEKRAASGVTVLAMVTRTGKLPAASGEVNVVTDGR